MPKNKLYELHLPAQVEKTILCQADHEICGFKSLVKKATQFKFHQVNKMMYIN